MLIHLSLLWITNFGPGPRFATNTEAQRQQDARSHLGLPHTRHLHARLPTVALGEPDAKASEGPLPGMVVPDLSLYFLRVASEDLADEVVVS